MQLGKSFRGVLSGHLPTGLYGPAEDVQNALSKAFHFGRGDKRAGRPLAHLASCQSEQGRIRQGARASRTPTARASCIAT
jgi:hypothetical protein